MVIKIEEIDEPEHETIDCRNCHNRINKDWTTEDYFCSVKCATYYSKWAVREAATIKALEAAGKVF